MTGPLLAIAKKEFTGVFKERTILLAVFIQVFVAGFSSLLVVGLSALVDPSSIPTYQAPELATDGESDLVRYMRDAGLPVRVYADRAEAMVAFERGGVDGAFFVRDTGDPDDPVDVELILPDGDISATLTLVQVKEVLADYEQDLRDQRGARLRSDPLYVDADVEAGQYSFVYSLLIPLLVALPIILSGGLMADSLTEEIQRGTLPLLLVSPASAADVVGGKLLANVAITPLLTVVWLGLLRLNGFAIPFVGALLIIVVSTALALTAGMLACGVALATRDRDRAQVIYAILFFFVGALALIAPVSPVNAIALLAAGSVHDGAYLAVLGSVLFALIGWLALQFGLRHAGRWMAAADA